MQRERRNVTTRNGMAKGGSMMRASSSGGRCSDSPSAQLKQGYPSQLSRVASPALQYETASGTRRCAQTTLSPPRAHAEGCVGPVHHVRNTSSSKERWARNRMSDTHRWCHVHLLHVNSPRHTPCHTLPVRTASHRRFDTRSPQARDPTSPRLGEPSNWVTASATAHVEGATQSRSRAGCTPVKVQNSDTVAA